jgi:dTDP-4-amino-4,6-dideoxygalactose transaminase
MRTNRTQHLFDLPNDQDSSGRTLGEEEIGLVSQAIRSGTLTSTKGRFVRDLEKEAATAFGAQHAIACSSGSAAVHAAIAAINPEPGDEIVTSPITDMGALSPILYQCAIPVFADVDPISCNVTAESIGKVLSERTRAIIVTHLFGQPCEMERIMALAAERRIPVIEDCAQAFGARRQGRLVGTFGSLACFSLQQGKHMTTGEGGLVTTNDESLARRVFLFVNKAWGYGDPNPDHYFLALNYRMSELQGAVALAQLRKLDDSLARRQEGARELTAAIGDIPGISVPVIPPGDSHAFWRYCLHIDGSVVRGGSPALGKLLKEQGIACAPRYIQKPAFQCEVFTAQRTFGQSRFPFTLARPEAVNYDPGRFPGSFLALERILVLPWNERYTNKHVHFIAEAIRDAAIRLDGAMQ